jgi:hypothetical protein
LPAGEPRRESDERAGTDGFLQRRNVCGQQARRALIVEFSGERNQRGLRKETSNEHNFVVSTFEQIEIEEHEIRRPEPVLIRQRLDICHASQKQRLDL